MQAFFTGYNRPRLNAMRMSMVVITLALTVIAGCVRNPKNLSGNDCEVIRIKTLKFPACAAFHGYCGRCFQVDFPEHEKEADNWLSIKVYYVDEYGDNRNAANLDKNFILEKGTSDYTDQVHMLCVKPTGGKSPIMEYRYLINGFGGPGRDYPLPEESDGSLNYSPDDEFNDETGWRVPVTIFRHSIHKGNDQGISSPLCDRVFYLVMSNKGVN